MTRYTLPTWMLLSAGFSTVGPEWNYVDVCSPFTRLYMVTDGEGELIFHDRTVHLSPGHMYIVPAFTPHTNSCRQSLTHYYLHVYEDLGSPSTSLTDEWTLPDELPATPEDKFIFDEILRYNPSIRLSEVDPRLYDDHPTLISMIKRSCEASLPQRMMTAGLISVIISRWLSHGRQRPSIMHSGIARVVDSIKENPCRRYSTMEMAAIAAMSHGHFSRLFRQSTGMTPQEYVRHQRLRIARMRLIAETTNIKTIALESGYDDFNYFTRIFTKVIGVSPSRYRREAWEGNI